MRLRDMTVDDLVSWGWSLILASTGIVFLYWVDVIPGVVLLVVGLAGMHAVRLRSRATVAGQSSSRAARSTTLASSSSDGCRDEAVDGTAGGREFQCARQTFVPSVRHGG